VDRGLLETVTHSFWDGVDGVLVVNLDARPDRWADVQGLLAGHVPPEKLTRLPATLGAALPDYGIAPWFRGRKRDKTWAGRAGCTLSHRAAIAHAKQHGWRTLLILEDDIELAPGFDTALAALPGALAGTGWDVCYLGYTEPVAPFRKLAGLPAGHALFRVSGASTTHAYLLRDTTFDWLLARLPSPSRIWDWTATHRAIDRWYYRNLARRFVVCAVSPAIIDQQGGFSDITQRAHEKVHATRVDHPGHGALAFVLLSVWRWLGFRLAEPRDWLRGQIKRRRGF
jgi:hypothetical protein